MCGLNRRDRLRLCHHALCQSSADLPPYVSFQIVEKALRLVVVWPVISSTRILARSVIMSPQIHAVTQWNPDPDFDPQAPEGIRLWARVLESFSARSDECYTWWGKVNVHSRLGMDGRHVDLLTEQIARQKSSGPETHLYMYCPHHLDDVTSFHVGKVIDVRSGEGFSVEDPHVPEFYRRLVERYDVPLWFKLSDIRKIRLDHIKHLLRYDLDSKKATRFDRVSFLSPCPVIRKPSQQFFQRAELENSPWKAWWEECLYPIVLFSDELSSDTGLPSSRREVFPLKTPAEMSRCVAPILKASTDILFIDPYFQPTEWDYLAPLKEFVTVALNGRAGKLGRMEYHLKSDLAPGEFMRRCNQHLPGILPEGVTLRLVLWKRRRPKGEKFHARFILTDLAGVQFEDGLSKDDAGSHVMVSLLTQAAHIEQWNRFQHKRGGTYEYVGEHEVVGRR